MSRRPEERLKPSWKSDLIRLSSHPRLSIESLSRNLMEAYLKTSRRIVNYPVSSQIRKLLLSCYLLYKAISIQAYPRLVNFVSSFRLSCLDSPFDFTIELVKIFSPRLKLFDTRHPPFGRKRFTFVGGHDIYGCQFFCESRLLRRDVVRRRLNGGPYVTVHYLVLCDIAMLDSRELSKQFQQLSQMNPLGCDPH